MPRLRDRLRRLLQRAPEPTPVEELRDALGNVRDALRGLEHPRELRHQEVRDALRTELRIARGALRTLPDHVRENLDPAWLELRDAATTLRDHAREHDLQACARVLREDVPPAVWAPQRDEDG